MNKKLRPATASVMGGTGPVPVRVRLRRINCDYAQPYPPDGQAREWWQRLRNAFGTASSAFVQASMSQLIAAARLPGSGISEIAVNASLAFIEGAKPKGEVECALVMQMACTHSAAMSVLGTFAGREHDRNAPLKASTASRLACARQTGSGPLTASGGGEKIWRSTLWT
jgi:hypothetical protein